MASEPIDPQAVCSAGNEALKPLSRARRVASQWAARLWQGAIGAAIVLLLCLWRRPQLTHAFADSATLWCVALAGIPTVGLLLHLGRGDWFAILGVRHFATYPPPWVAFLAGATMMLMVVCWNDTVGTLAFGLHAQERAWLRSSLRPVLAIEAAVIVSGLVAAWGLGRRRRSRPPPDPGLAVDLTTFTGVRTWLATDRPITGPHSDAFDHSRIAERIAARLSSNESGVERPSMAVIGSFGSGKTSIFNLVCTELNSRSRMAERVRLVRIGLWPYDSVEAAVAGILEALVAALEKEVWVPALRALPSQYVKLIESAGGLWSTASSFLGARKAPEETLSGFDGVAQTIGLHFVLWVEDLERFADGSEARERLGPIRALFHLLDARPSVSLVLATKNLYPEFDLDKLVRYVESIPELGGQQVSRILNLFRKGCFAQLRGKIDPAPASARKSLDKLGDPENEYHAFFGTKLEEPAEALARLSATPRVLKFALRRCLETWETLCGEIDFDDLLVMSLLRESEAEVFATLVAQLDDLRGIGFALRSDDSKGSAFSIALEQIRPERLPREAIQKLVDFAFPQERGRSAKKPQGMCHTIPRDYWRRFLAVPRLSECERDQPILDVCFGNDDQKIIDHLSDPKLTEIALHFLLYLSAEKRTRMTAERLAKMLGMLVDQRARQPGGPWPERSPPGMTSIWILLRARHEIGDAAPAVLNGVLADAIASYTRVNLQIVDALDYFFAWEHKGLDLLKDSQQDFGPRLRDLVGSALVQSYGQDPKALSEVLGRGDAHVLARIINRRLSAAPGSLPWSQWPVFAGVLLGAAASHPDEVLPALAALVVEEPHAQEFEYDRGRGELLFGHERVMTLFRGNEIRDAATFPAYQVVRQETLREASTLRA